MPFYTALSRFSHIPISGIPQCRDFVHSLLYFYLRITGNLAGIVGLAISRVSAQTRAVLSYRPSRRGRDDLCRRLCWIKRNRACRFAGHESLIIDNNDAAEIQAIGRGVSIRSRDSASLDQVILQIYEGRIIYSCHHSELHTYVSLPIFLPLRWSSV